MDTMVAALSAGAVGTAVYYFGAPEWAQIGFFLLSFFIVFFLRGATRQMQDHHDEIIDHLVSIGFTAEIIKDSQNDEALGD